MLRYLAGVISALLLVGAGVFLFRSNATTDPGAPAPRQAAVGAAAQEDGAEDALPSASAKTREEKRFGRYDKDKNSIVARAEYLQPRQKAFARLDTDHDGKLSFEEWSAKTIEKFADADKDKSATLTAAEFATTAVKRSPQRRVPCPPVQREDAD